MCIDIVEIWFGIANGQISACDMSICLFLGDNLSKYQYIFFSPNLVCAWILWRSGLGFLMGNFRQFLTVLCSRHVQIFIFGKSSAKELNHGLAERPDMHTERLI